MVRERDNASSTESSAESEQENWQVQGLREGRYRYNDDGELTSVTGSSDSDNYEEPRVVAAQDAREDEELDVEAREFWDDLRQARAEVDAALDRILDADPSDEEPPEDYYPLNPLINVSYDIFSTVLKIRELLFNKNSNLFSHLIGRLSFKIRELPPTVVTRSTVMEHNGFEPWRKLSWKTSTTSKGSLK